MFLHKRGKLWYLHYTDSQGRRQKISTKTSNRILAEKFKIKFSNSPEDLFEKHSSLFTQPPDTLDLHAFKKRIIEYSKLNFSKANVELYERVLRNLTEVIGNRLIDKITVVDIEKYKANRITKVSKNTVNIELRTLRAIFNIALQKWEIITKNPAKNVHQFSIPEKEKLSLSDEEINKLMKAIDDIRFKRIVLFALHSGCRASEIINLEWSDINFKDRAIIIRNKPTFKTKSGRIRQIPMNDTLYELLSQNQDKVLNMNGYVFTNIEGMKYRRDFLTHKFKHYIEISGLDRRFHLHCTRHTFITKLIKNNVSISKVMKLAGHSEISTTLGYTHMIVDDLREAINVINF